MVLHPASRPPLPGLPDSDLVRARTPLGDFDLTICTDGSYLLDGGAMFGVVPKPLWQQRSPADDRNRVLLGLNTVILRTGHHVIAIETGIGNKLSEKSREIHGAQSLLPQSLAAANIRPDEITIVINTHLHFDHCGWNTTLHPDGSVTPTFPNARYFAHKGEVDHGHLQLDRDRVSYLSPNYGPLIEDGRMTQLTTAPGQIEEIVPGIAVECFPGHTAQMLAVHIQPPGANAPHACYISDLIPTTAHLDPTWAMGYDLDPLATIENRKRFYARAIPEDWLVLFTHDHAKPMAKITINEKGKPAVRI
jgi:glyoxylase-like metal-dependent hydrolase (beta-lactamase superfamily II)